MDELPDYKELRMGPPEESCRPTVVPVTKAVSRVGERLRPGGAVRDL